MKLDLQDGKEALETEDLGVRLDRLDPQEQLVKTDQEAALDGQDPGDQLVRQEKVDHQDLQVQVVQEVQLVKEAYVVQLE